MTAFSLRARLHLGANSDLAFSLPQSYCLNPLCSPTAPSSEGAEAAPPQSTDFPRRKKCSNRFSVNAIIGRRYNPSVKPSKAKRLDSSPYTGEPRFALQTLSESLTQGSREVRARRPFSVFIKSKSALAGAFVRIVSQVTILVAVSVPSSS